MSEYKDVATSFNLSSNGLIFAKYKYAIHTTKYNTTIQSSKIKSCFDILQANLGTNLKIV